MAIEYRGSTRGVRFLVSAWSLLILTLPCGAVEFAGGRGEPNDPYLIATAEQFLGADFGVPGIHYRLTCDIDLGRRCLPEGDFHAHLDGAGFELQNAACTMGHGIFYVVETDGTITNLTLANFDVGNASDPEFSAGVDGVGGLAMLNLGTLSNCAAIGWVATSQVSIAGGLVATNRGSILNCYFDGWVGTSWEYEDEGVGPVPSRVGGLVGENMGSISNSFSRGVVVGKSGCGGLVGWNEGTIDNCYSTCMVIGDVGSGGLVADNWGSLRNCYASGRVMGRLRGGLIGMAGQYLGSATNCVWGITETDCLKSGAGVGFEGDMGWIYFAYNGWSGDPNWVAVTDDDDADEHPRLVWEGAPGQIIPKDSWQVFEAGSGTKDDPYVIRTHRDLDNLVLHSILWDKHFVLANDLNYYYGGFPAFSPIGICSGSSFSGSFDGNGHVIRNLQDDVSSPNKTTVWNFGLFGHVTGEVRNLVLENWRLASGANSYRVGLLAGTSEGSIKNCSVSGAITVGEKSRCIGGLIGVNRGQIIDCNATVTIEAGEGSTDIGPLVGMDDYHP